MRQGGNMENWKPIDFTASQIRNNIHNQIMIVPRYQRGQVWSEEKQKEFIDSIKKGYPFGTLLLYKGPNEETYKIIDGLQRTTAIVKYINNPSIIFNPKEDIQEDVLEKIIDLIETHGGSKNVYKQKIREIIHDWVIEDHETLEDITGMQFVKGAKKIVDELPVFKPHMFEISDLLEPMLKEYIILCESLVKAKIPAILYEGDQENLPEIFTRINSQGIKLSKYQILAASWSHINYEISSQELVHIHKYVDDYFMNLLSDEKNFVLENNNNTEEQLNLFQVIFGFSKILSEQYPYLFSRKKESDVESSGFNLISSCLGMKNSELFKMDKVLRETFETDIEFNEFLVKILQSVDTVDKLIEKYLTFTSNKRNNKFTIYHTELQICSIIASVFRNRYFHEERIEDNVIYTLNLNNSARKWTNYSKGIKKNLMKRYLIDILGSEWSGSGDSKLYEVTQNDKYYSEDITKDHIRRVMRSWYEEYKLSTNESRRVSYPSNEDKLILSIIYVDVLTVSQSRGNQFDIEHLATKNKMKIHLETLSSSEMEYKLPISSIGNICLLPEYTNRRKQDKTLYNDNKYKNEISKNDLTLEIVERDYSFTEESDLEWIEWSYDKFSDLKDNYFAFIDKRFSIMEQKVINSLFNNPYRS